MQADLASWAAEQRTRLDRHMSRLFEDAWPPSFAEPCRYPLFGGGKRMRPLLTIASFQAVCTEPIDVVLPAAAAVELVHTYSLVHDDLPCMDDDDERRGRPTVHRAFDEATAVLAGDALLTEAFAVIATCACPADVQVSLVRELAAAAGYQGMVGGQAGDIGLGASVTDEAVLRRIHALKTGALLRAAVRMGGITGGATPDALEQLSRYGEALGVAFQLADDVLDADEAEDDTGPPSFVRLLGLEATRARAEALGDEAIAIAQALDSGILVALARYTVERDI